MDRLHVWWPKNPKPGNFGDILTPFLIKQFFGIYCRYAKRPYEQPTLLGVGSIINHADKQCTVWGSGLMRSTDKLNLGAKYLSVRGPLTYEKLKENGINCPPIFGDPALLLPSVFNVDVKKTFEYGVFAHYVDTEQVRRWYKYDPSVLIIDPLNINPTAVVTELLKCKRIISSSLHGLIVAHAYGIPAVWVKHSDKLVGDDIKFHDYFGAVQLKCEYIDFQERIDVKDLGKFNYECGVVVDTNAIHGALEKYLIKRNLVCQKTSIQRS